MNRDCKICLAIHFPILMNIFIFGILQTLDFITMSENSYMVPTVFAFIVLYTIWPKRSGNVRNLLH